MRGNTIRGEERDHPAAGSKRKADDSNIGDSDRFFKRFNLLTLASANHANNTHYQPVARPTTSLNAPNIARNGDAMMDVDSTPDRVYIHDIDAELTDIEADEERLIFLPDIEARLSKIPQQVLQSRVPEDDHDRQELVLYSVPKSLTVDEGHDSVRKAILEARQRAREKSAAEAEDARQRDMDCKYDGGDIGHATETAHGYSAGYGLAEEEADPDAMDMD